MMNYKTFLTIILLTSLVLSCRDNQEVNNNSPAPQPGLQSPSGGDGNQSPSVGDGNQSPLGGDVGNNDRIPVPEMSDDEINAELIEEMERAKPVINVFEYNTYERNVPNTPYWQSEEAYRWFEGETSFSLAFSCTYWGVECDQISIKKKVYTTHTDEVEEINLSDNSDYLEVDNFISHRWYKLEAQGSYTAEDDENIQVSSDVKKINILYGFPNFAVLTEPVPEGEEANSSYYNGNSLIREVQYRPKPDFVGSRCHREKYPYFCELVSGTIVLRPSGQPSLADNGFYQYDHGDNVLGELDIYYQAYFNSFRDDGRRIFDDIASPSSVKELVFYNRLSLDESGNQEIQPIVYASSPDPDYSYTQLQNFENYIEIDRQYSIASPRKIVLSFNNEIHLNPDADINNIISLTGSGNLGASNSPVRMSIDTVNPKKLIISLGSYSNINFDDELKFTLSEDFRTRPFIEEEIGEEFNIKFSKKSVAYLNPIRSSSGNNYNNLRYSRFNYIKEITPMWGDEPHDTELLAVSQQYFNRSLTQNYFINRYKNNFYWSSPYEALGTTHPDYNQNFILNEIPINLGQKFHIEPISGGKYVLSSWNDSVNYSLDEIDNIHSYVVNIGSNGSLSKIYGGNNLLGLFDSGTFNPNNHGFENNMELRSLRIKNVVWGDYNFDGYKDLLIEISGGVAISGSNASNTSYCFARRTPELDDENEFGISFTTPKCFTLNDLLGQTIYATRINRLLLNTKRYFYHDELGNFRLSLVRHNKDYLYHLSFTGELINEMPKVSFDSIIKDINNDSPDVEGYQISHQYPYLVDDGFYKNLGLPPVYNILWTRLNEDDPTKIKYLWHYKNIIPDINDVYKNATSEFINPGIESDISERLPYRYPNSIYTISDRDRISIDLNRDSYEDIIESAPYNIGPDENSIHTNRIIFNTSAVFANCSSSDDCSTDQYCHRNKCFNKAKLGKLCEDSCECLNSLNVKNEESICTPPLGTIGNSCGEGNSCIDPKYVCRSLVNEGPMLCLLPLPQE